MSSILDALRKLEQEKATREEVVAATEFYALFPAMLSKKLK